MRVRSRAHAQVVSDTSEASAAADCDERVSSQYSVSSSDGAGACHAVLGGKRSVPHPGASLGPTCAALHRAGMALTKEPLAASCDVLTDQFHLQSSTPLLPPADTRAAGVQARARGAPRPRGRRGPPVPSKSAARMLAGAVGDYGDAEEASAVEEEGAVWWGAWPPRSGTGRMPDHVRAAALPGTPAPDGNVHSQFPLSLPTHLPSFSLPITCRQQTWAVLS